MGATCSPVLPYVLVATTDCTCMAHTVDCYAAGTGVRPYAIYDASRGLLLLDQELVASWGAEHVGSIMSRLASQYATHISAVLSGGQVVGGGVKTLQP